ncbi:MAG: hypothetical protein ACRDNK_23050 [Solirubrobacteraceae bacterium]
MTDAHTQKVTHSYVISYPAHEPRADDPHYRDFNEYRRRTKATAKCVYAVQTGDGSECDHEHPLELHHCHIEFALQNGVDLARLERVYPGVSDPDKVGAWVESAANLEWRCRWHHRGHGGVHSATASDYEAERFVRNLIR